MTDLLEIHGLDDSSKGRRELNSMKRVLSPADLKKNGFCIQKNKNCGIPQGSPISGVLANVYMLDVDKIINDFVSGYNGLYMRYSDDFIIALPHMGEGMAVNILTRVRELFNSSGFPGLELQPGKTQYYHFYENHIENCGKVIHEDADCTNRYLNFLGFTFDGINVSVRAKTVSKYYQRMGRKAKSIVKSDGYTKLGISYQGRLTGI